MHERSALTDRYEKIAEDQDFASMIAKKGDSRLPHAEKLADHINRIFMKVGGFDDSKLADKQVGMETQIEYAMKHVEQRGAFLGIHNEALNGRVMNVHEGIANVIELCQSPIEKLILPWLILEDYGPNIHTFPIPTFNHKRNERAPIADLFIAPQFALVRYRLDFALIARKGNTQKIFAVECDGSEYHDAKRDNVRDACMRSFGVSTVRGSGSQIHARPRDITAQVSSLIQEWMAQ